MKEKYSKSSTEEIQTTTAENWTRFLTLLFSPYMQYAKINEDEKRVSFMLPVDKKEAFKEHFYRVLKDKDSFQSILADHYKVQEAAAAPLGSMPADDKPLAPPTLSSREEAIGCIEKLFGIKTLKGDNGDFPVNCYTYFKHFADGILKSGDIAANQKIFAEQVQNYLCAHFKDVASMSIRHLLAVEYSEQHLPMPNIEELERATAWASGPVQSCFAIVTYHNGKSELHFNINKLLKLVYPPQLSDIDAEGITINLADLMLYVSQLSGQALLFSTDKDKRIAYPILLPLKESWLRPLYIHVLIDDSGSIYERNARGEIHGAITSLVSRVAKISSEANIKLTLFSGENQSHTLEFQAKDFNQNWSRTVPQFQGDTALFDAIDAAIGDDGSSVNIDNLYGRLNTHNNILIVITDGMNNDGSTQQHHVLEKIETIRNSIMAEGAHPPQVYTIGAGRVDEQVLQALSDSSQSKYSAVNSANGIADILREIQSFEHRRAIAQFTTWIDGEAKTHTIPIFLDGVPHTIKEVIIPLSDTPAVVEFRTPTKGQSLALNTKIHITRHDTETPAITPSTASAHTEPARLASVPMATDSPINTSRNAYSRNASASVQSFEDKKKDASTNLVFTR